ncbi:MAG: lipopolysaccharide biosynthesis protein [Rhodothalassiaceae bacterium]
MQQKVTPSLTRALAYVFGGRFMRAFIQVASAAVIARLLTPAEMGVFAVASAAVAVSSALAEFGIHPYIVQKDSMSREVAGRALGLMLLINWTIAAILFLARAPIAVFYGNPAIEDVIAILAVNFLLNPVGAIGLALLMRELRHGAYTILNLVASATAALVSVLFAFHGYGPLSLALGSVAMKISLITGILILRPRYLTFRPVFRGLRDIFGFGSWMMGGSMIQTIGTQTPDLIIGRLLGLEASGLYDRAMTMTRLINQQIAGALSIVLTPYFAEERRSGLDIKSRYLVRLRMTATIVWPLMLFLAVSSHSLVITLYGNQWEEAAPLAGILAISATFFMPFNVGRQLLLSQGRVRKLFFIEFILQASRILAVLIASRYGLPWIAGALMVPAMVHVLLFSNAVGEILQLKASDWIRAIMPGLVVSALTAIPLIGCLIFLGYRSSIPEPAALAIYSSLAGFGWLAAIKLARHPERKEIYQIFAKIIKYRK